MTGEFDIVFAPSAEDDLAEAVAYLVEYDPAKAVEWYQALREKIQSLSTMPERCPLAPESGLWGSEELRQLLFDDYPSVYRIIFTVTEDEVRILNIRHGARRYLHEEED